MLVQGLMNVVPLGSFTGAAIQQLFQPASALFQPASALSVLVQWPGAQLNLQESARQQRGGLIRHAQLHNGRLSTYSRVWFETWCARSPRAQARVKAFWGTLDFDYDPRRPSREEG